MSDARLSDDQRARLSVVGVVMVLLTASAFFRLLAWGSLEHTSLVFIGIPALLAIITALLPTPSSATGTICKVMTLALLISGVALGEAFVCVLFAAPLFFLVGITIGLIVDSRRRRERASFDARTLTLLAVVLAPASLEGVLPGMEFDREEAVTVVRVVDGSPADVAEALARRPRFERRLPLFLRLGFPAPGATDGSGLQPGDSRRIEFLHGHHPGTLVLTVGRSEPGIVDFHGLSDHSYITHWLAWRRAEVRWREIAPQRTEVSWTLTYRRRLDPAWYFKPLERYGVAQAAGYLIDTLATPSAE
jgi:hypothetical protein